MADNEWLRVNSDRHVFKSDGFIVAQVDQRNNVWHAFVWPATLTLPHNLPDTFPTSIRAMQACNELLPEMR